MLSSADKVAGQGVGSAYIEQVSLVKSSKLFDVKINSKEKTEYYNKCKILSEEISSYYSKENVLKMWKKFYKKVSEKERD